MGRIQDTYKGQYTHGQHQEARNNIREKYFEHKVHEVQQRVAAQDIQKVQVRTQRWLEADDLNGNLAAQRSQERVKQHQ